MAQRWRAYIDPAQFRAIVARQTPDIVLLTEVPPDLNALADGLTGYQTIPSPKRNIFEIAMITRATVRSLQVDRSAGWWLPVTTVEVCSPETPSERCVTIIALHA